MRQGRNPASPLLGTRKSQTKQGGAEQELVVCLPWIPVKSGLVQSDDAALSTPAGRVESTAMQYIPSWAHSSHCQENRPPAAPLTRTTDNAKTHAPFER